MAAKLIAKELALENLDEFSDPVSIIQEGLRAKGFHFRKYDIIDIWTLENEMVNKKDFSFGDAFLSTSCRKKLEVERIPRLLGLHGHFKDLVRISPAHPFDMTHLDLLTELYGNSRVEVFSDLMLETLTDGTTAREAIIVEFNKTLDSDQTILPYQDEVVFWPMPVKFMGSVKWHDDAGKVETNMRHWRYCCLKCEIKGGLDRFIDAIQDGSLSVIWVAASDDTNLQLMVKVNAQDRQSWEAEGAAMADYLQALGVVSCTFDFKQNFQVPGLNRLSELLYFNRKLL